MRMEVWMSFIVTGMVIRRITELSFSILIKADSDYAYSRNRNETLDMLNRLRLLAQLHGTPKSLLSRLDKRSAAETLLQRLPYPERDREDAKSVYSSKISLSLPHN